MCAGEEDCTGLPKNQEFLMAVIILLNDVKIC